MSLATLPNSGDYAELWSILTLASIQELRTNSGHSQDGMAADGETFSNNTPSFTSLVLNLYNCSMIIIEHF